MSKIKILLANLCSFPFRLFSKVSPLALLVNSTADKRSAICSFTRLYNSTVGKYSIIGRSCFINRASIGNFCSIADGCSIGVASHPASWVSTSPVFYSGKNILNKNFAQHHYESYDQTIIGNDVWIGMNVLIKSGIKVGDGSVIGACSVVMKDIPSYTIVGGLPAKIIRERFPDSIKKDLLESKWWDWNDAKLIEYAEEICDPKAFLQRVKEKE